RFHELRRNRQRARAVVCGMNLHLAAQVDGSDVFGKCGDMECGWTRRRLYIDSRQCNERFAVRRVKELELASQPFAFHRDDGVGRNTNEFWRSGDNYLRRDGNAN